MAENKENISQTNRFRSPSASRKLSDISNAEIFRSPPALSPRRSASMSTGITPLVRKALTTKFPASNSVLSTKPVSRRSHTARSLQQSKQPLLKRKTALESDNDLSKMFSPPKERRLLDPSIKEQAEPTSPLSQPVKMDKIRHHVSVVSLLSSSQRDALARRVLRGIIAGDSNDISEDDLSIVKSIAVCGSYSDTLRKHAYTALLSCNSEPDRVVIDKNLHPDAHQVKLDAGRSFTRLDPGHVTRAIRRKQLEELLNQCLMRQPHLHYYQGFGDICSVFVLLFGPSDALLLVETLAKGPLSDMMRANFDKVETKLSMIYPIIKAADEQVFDFLVSNELEPSFALSWLLTWFSRCFQPIDQLARLFDFFLATDAVYMPIYLAASIVLERRNELLSLANTDMAAVFEFLVNIPPSLSLNNAIDRCWQLYLRYPVRVTLQLAESQPQLPFAQTTRRRLSFLI